MNALPPVDEIVTRARGRVVRALTRGYGLSHERAEELCHDAVLLMLCKVRSGDLSYASGAILEKLARGLAANERRTLATRARIRRDHAPELTTGVAAAREDVLPDRLLTALADVDPAAAEIFLRRVVLGESAREVGRRVGLTPGSVDRRRDAVAATLRVALESREDGDRRPLVALAELLRPLLAWARGWWRGRGIARVAAALVVAGVLGTAGEVWRGLGRGAIPQVTVRTTTSAGGVAMGLVRVAGPLQRSSGLVVAHHASAPEPALSFEPLVALPTVAARGESTPVAASLDEAGARCPGTTPEADADCEDLGEQAAVVGALERATRWRDWQAALAISSLYLDRWPWGELEPTVRIHRAHALRAEAMWEELLVSVAEARQDPAYASMTAKLEHWSIEAMAHTGRCDDVWSGVRSGQLGTVSRRTARALCDGRWVAAR